MRQIPTVRFGGEGGADDILSEQVVRAIEQATAADRRAFGSTRIRIEVATPPMQRRRLRGLPQMPRRLLREMIAHQAPRFFRPSQSGLVVDAMWAPGPTSDEVIAVGMDRDLVITLLTAASRRGVTVLDIVPGDAGLPRGLSLMPEEERRRRRREAWRITARIASFTGILWGIILGVAFIRAALRGAEIHSELTRLRRPALQVREARRVMDTVAAMLATLAHARESRTAIGRLLDDLTAALPDSAVFSSVSLTLDGPEQVTGLALEPLRVLAAVHRPGERRLARLVGAPVVDAAGGRDWSRFVIRFDTNGSR